MEQAGSYCPYKGLIGEEARIGWEQNPQDRPDWEDIKKEYKNLDVKAYKKKIFVQNLNLKIINYVKKYIRSNI